MIAVRWQHPRAFHPSSWHLLKADDDSTTACGRQAPLDSEHRESDQLPGDERTCERCLLFAVKKADGFEGAPV